MTDPSDDLAATALRRATLLRTLAGEPFRQRDLVEEFDYARTTAYRTVQRLCEDGLLRETESGFVVTTRGRALGELAASYAVAADQFGRLEPLLSTIDDAALYERWNLFRDAEVVRADRGNPARVLDHLGSLLSDANRIRIVLSGPTSPGAFSRVRAALVDASEARLLLSDPALNAHRSFARTDTTALLESATVDVTVVERVPFTALVTDDECALVGHDGDVGIPAVLGRTGDVLARRWLEERISQLRRDGRTLSPSEDPGRGEPSADRR